MELNPSGLLQRSGRPRGSAGLREGSVQRRVSASSGRRDRTPRAAHLASDRRARDSGLEAGGRERGASAVGFSRAPSSGPGVAGSTEGSERPAIPPRALIPSGGPRLVARPGPPHHKGPRFRRPSRRGAGPPQVDSGGTNVPPIASAARRARFRGLPKRSRFSP